MSALKPMTDTLLHGHKDHHNDQSGTNTVGPDSIPPPSHKVHDESTPLPGVRGGSGAIDYSPAAIQRAPASSLDPSIEHGRTGAVQHHDILRKGDGLLASEAHKEGSDIPTYTSTHTKPLVGGDSQQDAHRQTGGVTESNTPHPYANTTDTGAFDANRQLHERATVDPSSGTGVGHGVSNTTHTSSTHHQSTGTDSGAFDANRHTTHGTHGTGTGGGLDPINKTGHGTSDSTHGTHSTNTGTGFGSEHDKTGNTTHGTHGTGTAFDSEHNKTGTGHASAIDKVVGKTQQAVGKALKKPEIVEKGEIRATEGKQALQ